MIDAGRGPELQGSSHRFRTTADGELNPNSEVQPRINTNGHEWTRIPEGFGSLSRGQKVSDLNSCLFVSIRGSERILRVCFGDRVKSVLALNLREFHRQGLRRRLRVHLNRGEALAEPKLLCLIMAPQQRALQGVGDASQHYERLLPPAFFSSAQVRAGEGADGLDHEPTRAWFNR